MSNQLPRSDGWGAFLHREVVGLIAVVCRNKVMLKGDMIEKDQWSLMFTYYAGDETGEEVESSLQHFLNGEHKFANLFDHTHRTFTGADSQEEQTETELHLKQELHL